MRTAINLYTVRNLDEHTLDVLDRVADAGYDGVQVSGVDDASPAEIARKCDALGLDTTPSHVGLERLEDDPEAAADDEHTLESAGAVVPWMSEEQFESPAAAQETADRLDGIGDALADHHLDLHYHNHAHEFVAVDADADADADGRTGFEAFAEAASVGLELDVGWVLVGGRDPAELIERYADQIDLVHMKDMDTSVERGFVEIGTGDVDMEACAEAAHDAGATWLIYEHDQPENPARSIDVGAEFLADLA
jgi:sugar phosphate isomerase/epimerase